VACDHITTIPAGRLGRQIGRLLDQQEAQLTNAIHAAFDLKTT
jgi:mRNA-degrading endonuclease toxin of MazEF toxin-antitoxin module